MKKIYSVLVENRSGVLCKVAGLFSRRCFNIDSLAVGETDDSAVSCMTIVSSGNQRTLEQIEKQLNKKLDIIKVHLDNQVVNHVQRDQLLLPLDCLRVKVVQRERIKHQLDSRVVLPVPTENIQLQREV